MSWLKITDDERKQNIKQIIIAETGLNNFNENSVINTIFTVLYKIVNVIYAELNKLLKETVILTSSGFFLDMQATMVGLKRYKAEKAKRYFIGTSYGSGMVKEGTFFNIVGTDLRFKVINDVSFTENQTFNIPVEAEFEGTQYNISQGYSVKSGKVINGLESITISDQPQYFIQAGKDEETDDSLRLRVMNRWVIASDEAPPSKYISVTKSIQGVDDVKIVRTPRGSGSIDVIINIIDGGDETQIVSDVINAIDEIIGIAKDVQVKVATPHLISMSVTFSSDENTEGEVRTVIEEFFRDTKINEVKKIAELYSFAYLHPNLKLTSLVIEPNEDFIGGANTVLKLDSLVITKI